MIRHREARRLCPHIPLSFEHFKLFQKEEIPMFNPIKTTTSLLMTAITLLLLTYTHAQAFKAGIGVAQNPFLHRLTQILGMASPQSPCPSSENPPYKPWWKGIPDVNH